MKRLVFSSAIILALIITCAAMFSLNTPEAVSKTAATGTITVCWANYCTSDPTAQLVYLVSEDGIVYGSCILYPQNDCCDITGDFPTGKYYFSYSRLSGGVSDCSTSTFRYTNGTNVTLNVICDCP